MDIIIFIQQFSNPILDIFFQFITFLGEESFFILVASIFLWFYDYENGKKICWIFLTGSILNSLLKIIFHTPRPIGIEGIRSLRTETAPGYAFPSGHTQGSTTFWTALSLIYKNIFIIIAGIIIVILIAFSRLYLGVHWPIDVIGGFIIGLAWAFLSFYFYNKTNFYKNNILISILIILFLIIAFISNDSGTVKSTGALIGYLISLIIINKTNFNFIPSKKISILNILKFFFGLSILLAIKNLLKILLPSHIAFDLLRYSFIGIWLIIGAPFVFSYFDKKIIKK